MREVILGDSFTGCAVGIEPAGGMDKKTVEVLHHVIFFVDRITGFGVVPVTGKFPETTTTFWSEKDFVVLERGTNDDNTGLQILRRLTREEVVLGEVTGDRGTLRRGVVNPRTGFHVETADEATGETDMLVDELAKGVRVAGLVDFVVY